MSILVRFVGGPCDGKQADFREPAAERLIVPRLDPTSPPGCAVWAEENTPMAITDPDGLEWDELYLLRPDGKYRQTSFVENEYRLGRDEQGPVYRYVGTAAQGARPHGGGVRV